MAIDYDLEKIQFLDWISRQFRKDFDDIRTVDTSIKDTFEFTLKSGDEVSIKCKFDDLFSDYFSGSSGAEVYNKLLACIGINKDCYRIADAFKENTKEGIKAYINMSKYEYNKFTNREKPKLNFPKISLFEFSLKNTLMDMITDKVIERLDKDTYNFVMNNSNEDVKHTVKGLTKEMMDNGEITIEKQAVDILQSKYNIPESELKNFLERHAVEKVTDEPVKVEVPEAPKKDEIYRQGDKYFQNGKEIDDGVFINTVHLNGKHAMDNMFKYTPNLLNELLDTTVDLHSMRDKLDNTELSIMNNIDTFFRSMIDRASLYAYEEGDDIPFDKMKELNGIDFTKTDAAVVYKFLKENSASIVNVISYDESNHIPLNTSAYNRRLCKEAVYKMNDYVKALDKDNDKNINTASFKEESFKDKNNRVNQVR